MWKAPVKDPQLAQAINSKLEELTLLMNSNAQQLPLSLINGDAGTLLFDCYRSRQLNNSDHYEHIEQKVLRLFENLMLVNNGTFSSGVAGILWSLDHLNKNAFIEIDDENFSDVSKSLSFSLIKNGLSKNFDYLHGANGIALYLLNREEKDAHMCFDHWLDLLYESGIKTEDTITWNVLLNFKEKLYGNCLGLAHGTPSTIIILTKLLRLFPNEKALDLLNRSINFLLANRNEGDQPSFFPNYVKDGKSLNSTRPAWCYGDLGCAVALFEAGSFLKRNELSDLALHIIRQYAQNVGIQQLQYITDADFCHGTVGVAHVFARFYNHTGDEAIREAAEFYYARTLEMAYHNDGLAGYKHFGEDKFESDYSLLEGIAGIGLSLISAVSDIEPNWDSCFLLS